MGTVHKFKRPPKNENQFKGFSPFAPEKPKRAAGRWRKLKSWHRTLIAWGLLISLAAAIVVVRTLVLAHR